MHLNNLYIVHAFQILYFLHCRSWAQFTCYVYNNGKPDQPGLTPLDVQEGQEIVQRNIKSDNREIEWI